MLTCIFAPLLVGFTGNQQAFANGINVILDSASDAKARRSAEQVLDRREDARESLRQKSSSLLSHLDFGTRRSQGRGFFFRRKKDLTCLLAAFLESGYSPDEIAHARGLLGNLDWDNMMQDIAAAKDNLQGVSPIGIVGFCMGGSAAFLAACLLPGFSASVALYGGQIGKFADEKPKCPLQMHFGAKDDGLPLSIVEEIKKKQPQAETYIYEGAPHGFYCDERASYRKKAGDLAWKRALEFLNKHMK